MREEAVMYGSLCTAQGRAWRIVHEEFVNTLSGAINLIADVAIALW
jgi:hypothetical protein